MLSEAPEQRFLTSGIVLSPKEVKQLAGLMALIRPQANDMLGDIQSKEHVRQLTDEAVLEKSLHATFHKEAVPVDVLSDRSTKAPKDLWEELQYRLQLQEEHKYKEAQRLAALEAEGRTTQRYYRRKALPSGLIIMGLIVAFGAYGLYRRLHSEATASHQVLLGSTELESNSCQISLGPDGPSQDISTAEQLPSQKVYRVFARCAGAGYLHLQYQQSLPAVTNVNIPIAPKADWQLLSEKGKALTLYVSGPEVLRVRLAFSKSPLQASSTLDMEADERPLWIAEHKIPLSAGVQP